VELLLNLLWLLLVIPAAWMWRETRSARPDFDSRRTLLLLACVVILLFPIISVSDDLQAMRPEAEESVARDALRHNHFARVSAHADHSGNGPALVPLHSMPAPGWAFAWQAITLAPRPSLLGFAAISAGRSPPSVSLS
jgi:hypothetical protein